MVLRHSLMVELALKDANTREIIVAEESEIAEMYALLRKKNMRVEPSSATAFVALNKLKDSIKEKDSIVVVNTGRGLYFD